MTRDQTVPDSTTIEFLSQAVYPSMALLAGMQLDLFSALKEGNLTCDQLSEAMDVRSGKLRPLLFALVNVRLLETDGETFRNTAEADTYLVRGRREFMGDRHLLWSDIWRAALSTGESIRRGRPQAKHDFSTMTDDQLLAFFSGLHPNALAEGRRFAQQHDLSGCRRFLDAGGGSGGFAIGVAEVCPEIEATVVDLPNVAPVTRHFVQTAATDRVRVLAADLSEELLLGSFDVAVLKNLLQVMDQSSAQQVVRHVFQALDPGGLIYLTGHILDDSRLTPSESVAFNLVFLNIYEEGQAYTQKEYSDWLTVAGFEKVRFVNQELLIARKPEARQ